MENSNQNKEKLIEQLKKDLKEYRELNKIIQENVNRNVLFIKKVQEVTIRTNQLLTQVRNTTWKQD